MWNAQGFAVSLNCASLHGVADFFLSQTGSTHMAEDLIVDYSLQTTVHSADAREEHQSP